MAKQKFADDAIKNWRSQKIYFYSKISLVVLYPWQVSLFHTWKRIHTICSSCETRKVVNLPSPSLNKTQITLLKVGLTFSINSISMKVFRMLYLHTEQRKNKRFLAENWMSLKAAIFCISVSASIGKNSMDLSEYFNGRSIDRCYIGFTSKTSFMMLHLTSFTISLTPLLKWLTPTKIF